jgi:hypothetical protein
VANHGAPVKHHHHQVAFAAALMHEKDNHATGKKHNYCKNLDWQSSVFAPENLNIVDIVNIVLNTNLSIII